MASSAASSPSKAKNSEPAAEESHIRLGTGGCPAPGLTEVSASPCGGDFAAEVTSIVAVAGAGLLEGVAASDRALPAARGLNGAECAARGLLSPRKPPPRGTHFPPALEPLGSRRLAGCSVGSRGARRRARATRRADRESARVRGPRALVPRPRRAQRAGPEPRALLSAADPVLCPPGSRRSAAAGSALEGVSRQQKCLRGSQVAATAHRRKRKRGGGGLSD